MSSIFSAYLDLVNSVELLGEELGFKPSEATSEPPNDPTDDEKDREHEEGLEREPSEDQRNELT